MAATGLNTTQVLCFYCIANKFEFIATHCNHYGTFECVFMIKKWCEPYVSVFLPCLNNFFPPFCLFDKKKKHKTVIKVHLFGFHADICQSLIDLSEEKLHINIVHQTGRVCLSFVFSLIESMKLFMLVALFGLLLAQHNPPFKYGRTSIVHLFE